MFTQSQGTGCLQLVVFYITVARKIIGNVETAWKNFKYVCHDFDCL